MKEKTLASQACLRRYNEWESQFHRPPQLTDVIAAIDAIRVLLPASVRRRYDTSDYSGVARMHRLLALCGEGDDRS